MTASDRRPAAGFTIIELLVVMAIVATLAGLGIWGIPRMIESGKVSSVENAIMQLHAALEAYQNHPRNGDYPPTVLDNEAFPGVGVRRNDENLGIESVVLCINRKGQRSSFDVENLPWKDGLDNVDGDRTQAQLTDLGDGRQLFEILDQWETPLVYFHHRDYAQVEAKNLGRVSGIDGVIKAKPWKNPKTGGWFQRNGFQIISAGPDRTFNTDDDITNFIR